MNTLIESNVSDVPSSAFGGGMNAEDLIHELRQPLGVIETLAYYLELRSSDEKTCIHLRQIQAMVQKANRILVGATVAAPATPAAVEPRILARSTAV